MNLSNILQDVIFAYFYLLYNIMIVNSSSLETLFSKTFYDTLVILSIESIIVYIFQKFL